MGQAARSSILFSAGFVPVQDVSTFISIPQAFPHCKGDFASPSRVYFTPPHAKAPCAGAFPPAQGAFFPFARMLPGLLVHAVLAVGKAHSVPLHRRIIAGIAIGDIIIRITAPIVTTIDPVFAADFLDYISTILIIFLQSGLALNIHALFIIIHRDVFHRAVLHAGVVHAVATLALSTPLPRWIMPARPPMS